MTKCTVKNCHSVSTCDSTVTFHSFPSSIQLNKLWLQQMGNAPSDVDASAQNLLQSNRTGGHHICSKHFSPKSYIFDGTKMVLKPDAVPTVFQEVPNVSEIQDDSKTPSCTKVQRENLSNVISSLPQSLAQVFSPQLGATCKGLIKGHREISETGDMNHDLMLAGKSTVDKSVGTDPHCDFIETKSEKLMNKRLLKLAMEIISLLTGEEYVMVKKNLTPPSDIQNGESQVPIKCGDVSVYFTMEEWDYIEEHRDLYQKVVMENHQRSCSPVLEEPEICTEDIKTVLVTEEEDDGSQSQTETEPVDVSTSTYTGEFGPDSVSVSQAVEETYVLNSWETSVVHEASCAEDDLQEDSYALSSSSSNLAKHNTSSFHGSQLEDCGENFSIASPRHTMDNLAYTSTSEQCEEQGWTAYNRYVGDADFTSTENLQIKEETSQYNYMYDEEATYADHNPVRVCEEQNQLFETMNNLLIHQMAHGQSSSVDKPYACNHCDKRFAKRSHLGMHLKTHTGEKPYACPDCGKRFSRRSNMATHYRTHTGEKPFACPKCGKRFTQSSHMVTHQRTHSTDKLFTCPECKKCFTKWSYLNFHLRTHGIEKLSVP